MWAYATPRLYKSKSWALNGHVGFFAQTYIPLTHLIFTHQLMHNQSHFNNFANITGLPNCTKTIETLQRSIASITQYSITEDTAARQKYLYAKQNYIRGL